MTITVDKNAIQWSHQSNDKSQNFTPTVLRQVKDLESMLHFIAFWSLLNTVAIAVSSIILVFSIASD